MSYKVTIVSGKDAVWFEASAPITESRSANYTGHDIIHLPTDIWAYKNTTARSFQITAKIVSRNADEAKANSRYLDLIRSWVLPDFGNSGATPPIVKLSAFYNTNIDKVPCIIKSYSFGYPEDVDWIYAGAELNAGTGRNKKVGSSAMPVIMSITVDLSEAYTPAQITARYWKMSLSKGGGFVLGGANDDVTSSGGGKQQIGEGTLTPNMIDLTGDSSFTGIASSKYSHVKSSVSVVANGNNASTYGIKNSQSITKVVAATTPTPTTQTTPISTGIFPTGLSATTQNNALSTFGRNALPSQAPSFITDTFLAVGEGGA